MLLLHLKLASCVPSSCSSSPKMLPPGNQDDGPTHYALCPSAGSLRHGTVIPNRIFVGGIDYKVNESDLRHVFSQHGAVKEVKIVIDRSGMSKGYGFVTFETQDDAMKILHDVSRAGRVCFKDKKLSIGQAVPKSDLVTFPDSATPRPMSCENTPAGLPYIYHNGVAYFQCPNMSPLSHHWPCAPNQYQWNVVQSPMPPSPVVYSQQSEYLYQPADGGPVPPPLPAMEDAPPECVCVSANLPPPPPPRVFKSPSSLQNLMFPHAQVHLKPKYCRFIHRKDYRYPPEAAEPPDASMLHTHQPLM
uniref:Protein boule-like n=1 Tax=Cyclopterus lumpus TaxID=8103 RepID=A0A8C2ZIT7_CYCLU